MIKSKHSGWTYDLQRTPFKGGGIVDSISNAVSSVGNAISNAGVFIDKSVTQPVGKGLAEVDTTVRREIPGGWTLPAAIAVAYATGYIDPSLFATEAAATAGAEAGAGAIATEAGSTAFFDALATGASSTEAVNAGLAADAAFGSAGEATAVTATPGADAVLGSSSNIANLTPTGAGNFGSIVAPSANAVTNSAGLTGAIGAGTMVGDGTLGTTIGQTYMTAAPGQFAVDASGAAIPAGASGIAGTTPSLEISASDVLKNVNRLKQLANLVNPAGGKPTAQQFAQFQAANAPIQEQFGGYYQMNKNPFAQTQQPTMVQNPLGKTQDFLAQLAQEGKPAPTLADLLRTA